MKYLSLQKDSSIKVDESSKSILSQEGGTNLLYPSISDEIIKVYNNKDNSILDNVECDKYAEGTKLFREIWNNEIFFKWNI